MNEKNHLFSNHALKMLLIPLVAEQFLTSLMGTADSMMVSNVGSAAISAVSLVDSINVLVIQAFAALSAGGTIVCSQYIGQKNLKKATESARQLLLAVASISVLVMVVCLAFRTPLLRLVFGKVDAEVMDASKIYFLITSLSFPFIALYDAGASVYRAQGDSATPLRISVVANCLNITGNAVLIWVFHMGVAGAAWATVLSQLISGILCFLYMRKQYDILKFEKDEMKFEGRQAIILCNMGIPMGLQYSITAIGSVILQTAVNSLGSQAVAAVTAAGRISGFSCCPFDALGSTMATYAGQNVGAGKLDRVGKGLKSASFIGGIYAILAFFVLSLFGRQIALLFVSADEIAILDHVKQFLVFNTAFYIPLCLVNTVRFCIQGMGYSRLAILAGVCEMVGRIIASLVLVPLIGFVGICLASPIAWIMADLFLVPAYCHTINRMKKILAS